MNPRPRPRALMYHELRVYAVRPKDKACMAGVRGSEWLNDPAVYPLELSVRHHDLNQISLLPSAEGDHIRGVARWLAGDIPVDRRSDRHCQTKKVTDSGVLIFHRALLWPSISNTSIVIMDHASTAGQ